MSSFTRRMQRAHSLKRKGDRLDPWGKFLRTGNASGLIHFGDRLGIHSEIVNKGVKPKTWRSGHGTVQEG